MPVTAPQTTYDPLRSFMAAQLSDPERQPVPLVRTDFDVEIDGGLAVVTTNRLFRNTEDRSIEATMTFPVPVHAILFRLEVRTEGRALQALAQRRDAARETYEEGIEQGKLAVLHEEVLRGIHTLSVGQLAPNAEIEVETTWAMPLTFVKETGSLRIPLTVGHVYGRSPLADSDDLITGDPLTAGTLAVQCANGDAQIIGRGRIEGREEIPMNAPIDIAVTGQRTVDLHGCRANGQSVTLRIEPDLLGERSLDVAFLIDHSGSMDSPCWGEDAQISKHDAVRRSLVDAEATLLPGDAVDIWQFDNVASHVGTVDCRSNAAPGTLRSEASSVTLYDIARRLAAPSGGTEIGESIQYLLGASSAQDILLITDGQSYELDVQSLAASGRRFSVVLIGEDSLEANVGHLAALTGGDVFIGGTQEVAACICSALSGMRRLNKGQLADNGDLVIHRNGARIIVKAGGDMSSSSIDRSLNSHALAAVAASLETLSLDEDAAVAVCLAENLVGHLTSLVLVDQESEIQDSIPVQRKMALPVAEKISFRAVSDEFVIAECYREPFSASSLGPERPAGKLPPPLPASSSNEKVYAEKDEDRWAPRSFVKYEETELVEMLPWDTHPNELAAGDLSILDEQLMPCILEQSGRPEVEEKASQLGIAPEILVIFVYAHAHRLKNRSAARIARLAAMKVPQTELDALCDVLELSH